MIAQSYQLYVERKDATRNMARYYAMSIEATLFGDVCLTRRWGRIGARGQARQHHFEREEDAVLLFLELLRRKRMRGYRPHREQVIGAGIGEPCRPVDPVDRVS
ncbi:MAG: WGR domain-containing protein [Shinella sp.]|nr:WGR domain-containing protein [Shinella sp.]